MSRLICIISAVIWVSTLSSCNKDARAKEAILGAWVSVDQSDTLVFINEEQFEQNFYPGVMELYLYSIDRDSITVQYSGSHLVLVLPSTHYFEVDEDALSIDFSKGCYGFPIRKMDYYSADLE